MTSQGKRQFSEAVIGRISHAMHCLPLAQLGNRSLIEQGFARCSAKPLDVALLVSKNSFNEGLLFREFAQIAWPCVETK